MHRTEKVDDLLAELLILEGHGRREHSEQRAQVRKHVECPCVQLVQDPGEIAHTAICPIWMENIVYSKSTCFSINHSHRNIFALDVLISLQLPRCLPVARLQRSPAIRVTYDMVKAFIL